MVPDRISARLPFPVFFDAPHFVWWAFAMLSRLIDHCGGQQLRRIEFTNREALEPRFLPTGEAVKLRSPVVPQLNIDSVGAALAEEQDGHDR
jgi:hypothetical protein